MAFPWGVLGNVAIGFTVTPAQAGAETIRDARQTENIAKEIPASQVFDFSYLPQLLAR